MIEATISEETAWAMRIPWKNSRGYGEGAVLVRLNAIVSWFARSLASKLQSLRCFRGVGASCCELREQDEAERSIFRFTDSCGVL
jgi:hypothetical protein